MKDNFSTSRRKLLQYGAIAFGSTVVAKSFIDNSVLAESADDAPKATNEDITPDEALNMLMEGNKRFVTNKRKYPDQNFERIAEVAKEQFPFASILGCSDSRVPLEILFDQGFGDIFVVRNAGNIVTPEETGSLEFGSAVAGAKAILVIGHEKCGAVTAAVAGKPVPGSIGSILAAIQPAMKEGDKNDKNYLTETIKNNVFLQINNLKSSPVLAQLIKENKLKIFGGYYDLDTAQVQIIT
ncbi:carbonic anhydrase [Pleurocapsa sp. FMAR1]|uniref:carbonic anhydrase n=1 Tax=Pleurocapsa sp. FMAR1 TaxID=3040204 RepID=UPI0029C7C8BD|nr:carbonic anhydrase [Pleurocapsa sp. FMAR1]